MAGKTTSQETTLQIKRRFTAPREEVFRAWTDPEALKRWFAPSDDFSTPVAEVDLRVGGRYRIQMRAPDGEPHTVGGVYREISPPGKLVFTWAWEEETSCGGAPMDVSGDTLVTVEFHDRGGATEMVLTHERFADKPTRDKHNEGWTGCLDRLAKVVQ